MLLDIWGQVLSNSFASVWAGFFSFVPNLIVAIIIFVVGWVVGAALSKVIAQLIRMVKVDGALRAAGIEELVKKMGMNLNSGVFIGELVKWFIIVVFLIASFEVLGLAQVNIFLTKVVIDYLPQVIAAVLILLIAAVLAEAMRKVVIGSAQAAEIKSASFLGAVTKWAIWVFAILAALFQLGIAATFIQTLFTGVVIAVALAVGLAFGLGGQEAAARWLDKAGREISER